MMPERGRRAYRDKLSKAAVARWKRSKGHRYRGSLHGWIALKRETQRYDLTVEDLVKVWKRQRGHCAICPRKLRRGTGGHSIDHDHKTNRVRGFLCIPCNVFLGWFEKHGNAAIKYLRRSK